ncbi:MAG: hypothetical protein RRZ84_06625 [Romboutsia sp.]
MMERIYSVFAKEIESIIKNNNTIAVFLVGSSKSIDFNVDYKNINDIDIFVFVGKGKNQVRIIKTINNIEFDINYFSKSSFERIVDNKEYFFLKEMKDAKVIYDKNNTATSIINLCRTKYLEGPRKLLSEEKVFLKLEIGSKISRLKETEKFKQLEYDFLTKIYLKDIIMGYFSIKDKWIPKDKNLLKNLKKEDSKLFELVEKVYEECNYNNLLNIYEYVFKEIKADKIIKITY